VSHTVDAAAAAAADDDDDDDDVINAGCWDPPSNRSGSSVTTLLTWMLFVQRNCLLLSPCCLHRGDSPLWSTAVYYRLRNQCWLKRSTAARSCFDITRLVCAAAAFRLRPLAGNC